MKKFDKEKYKYYLLMLYPFHARPKLSQNINRDVVGKMRIDNVKLILSLSSAIVVLTFSIIQLVNKNENSINHIWLIKTCWITILMAIVVGILFMYQYVENAICWSRLRQEQDEDKRDKEAKDTPNRSFFSDYLLRDLETLQLFLFFIGAIFLVCFAFVNI